MITHTSNNTTKKEISYQESLIVLVKHWFSGGVANAITSAILNPMDVVKTRLQSRSPTQNHQDNQLRMIQTLINMYKEGGWIGLWQPGLMASVIREMINSGARAGFYTTVRDMIIYHRLFQHNNHHLIENELLPKILSAMITGTLGSILANPIDVIKIRLMTNPQLYPSTLKAFPIIITNEGISGLYKGVYPSTLRGAFIAIGELATYDHAKSLLRQYGGLSEGSTLHIISSLITGLVATTVAAPFDMIKTRAMNETTSTNRIKHNFIHLFINIIKNEGPMTLFRGWLPAYLRLGPHAIICFPIFEQIRITMGLGYL